MGTTLWASSLACMGKACMGKACIGKPRALWAYMGRRLRAWPLALCMWEGKPLALRTKPLLAVRGKPVMALWGKPPLQAPGLDHGAPEWQPTSKEEWAAWHAEWTQKIKNSQANQSDKQTGDKPTEPPRTRGDDKASASQGYSR